jgi:ribonuclease-3 family protein
MDNLFEMEFTAQQVGSISNLGLAHIGDGVFELLCRSYLCLKGDKTVLKLHKDTVELVRAPAQAKFAEKLLPLLTEEETAFFRRGKNAHTHAHPKAATAREYALATGVEALFGALYLMGQKDRLNELFLTVMEALYGV